MANLKIDPEYTRDSSYPTATLSRSRVYSGFVLSYGHAIPIIVGLCSIGVNQIPCVIFQVTSQFSFEFCITLQCHDT